MRKHFLALICCALLFGTIGGADAALIVRGTDTLGNQLIYDTDRNITWYDYDSHDDLDSGKNTWGAQLEWASRLTVDFDGITFSDWRLPTAINQDGSGPSTGFNCTQSEMGHLYYTKLGNVEVQNAPPGSLGNSGPFQHLASSMYWSGTGVANDSRAWDFDFNNGHQKETYSGFGYHAIAVMDGDVMPTPVPIPGTILLLGPGLGVLAGIRIRRKKKSDS